MDFVASQFEARSEPLPRQDNVPAACGDGRVAFCVCHPVAVAEILLNSHERRVQAGSAGVLDTRMLIAATVHSHLIPLNHLFRS